MFKSKGLILAAVLVTAALLTVSCAPAAQSSIAPESAAASAKTETSTEESKTDNQKITIGLSMGDQRLERWQRDYNYMIAAAESMGATIFSQSADGDEQKQITQIDAMLSKGIDVLIVIPINSDSLATAIQMAHEENIKVIAYDRMINNVDLDYHITFDMEGVGRQQAEFLVDLVPKGRYFLMEGDKGDNNAQLFYKGHMGVLQPYIDKGDIEIVGEQWAGGWLEENAMKLMEQGLTATNNKIDAICDANDSTASGAIQALEAQGLAGKIPITGQDADLAACKRIVAGTQTMDVYKSLQGLATAAIKMSIDIVQGNPVETNAMPNNGFKEVPSAYLPTMILTKDNMMETVIADGFHSYDDVYADVPQAERPAKP